MEDRLDAVHTAARKFRLQIADIPRRLEEMKDRLADLQSGGNADALRGLGMSASVRDAARARSAIARTIAVQSISVSIMPMPLARSRIDRNSLHSLRRR